MYKKIAELHRELRAQTTSEAEILFLDHCKHLALYGIHSFKAVVRTLLSVSSHKFQTCRTKTKKKWTLVSALLALTSTKTTKKSIR